MLVSIHANIRGTVHEKNVAIRQQKIHYGENGFLHLSRILCAANQDNVAGEISDDEDAGPCAVAFRDGLKLGSDDYGELRHMIS